MCPHKSNYKTVCVCVGVCILGRAYIALKLDRIQTKFVTAKQVAIAIKCVYLVALGHLHFFFIKFSKFSQLAQFELFEI